MSQRPSIVVAAGLVIAGCGTVERYEPLIHIGSFHAEGELAAEQRSGEPRVLVGDDLYALPAACLTPPRSLGGDDERRDLGRDAERRELGSDREGDRELGRDTEGRELGSDREGGRELGRDSEGRTLGRDGEGGRELGRDSQGRTLGRDSEGGRELGRDSQGRTLGRDGEGRTLGRDAEGDRELGRDAEDRTFGRDAEGRELGGDRTVLGCQPSTHGFALRGASRFVVLGHAERFTVGPGELVVWGLVDPGADR